MQVSDDPSLRLAFSCDTLSFDTLFTGQGSATMQAMVYNPNPQALRIQSVRLREGRYFHINLDGEADTTRLRDIVLQGGDSLFLFVKVYADPQHQDQPVLLSDELLFSVNDRVQTMHLEAYGQDVRRLRNYPVWQDMTLTADRPYLIYGYLYVDSLATLTIEPGATLYFHDGAQLWCYGRMVCNGTAEQPIHMTSDRLDNIYTDIPYSYVAGRWSGVYLISPATTCLSHTISHLDIQGAEIGLYCYSTHLSPLPAIRIDGSRIHNCSSYGLVLQNIDAQVSNTEVSNTADHCVYLAGGKHEIIYSTIASYFNATNIYIQNTSRQHVPAVYIHNLSKNMAKMETRFINSIILGIEDNNITLATPFPDTYTGLISHCYLRADSSQLPIYQDNLFYTPEDSACFVNTFYSHEDYLYYDFHLDSLSPALDMADTTYLQAYPTDRDGRMRQHAIGAYEL